MKPRKRHKEECVALNCGSRNLGNRSHRLFSWRSPILSKYLFFGIMIFVLVVICLTQTLGANQNEDDAYSKFFESYAKPLLVPRPPGSENSLQVVKYLNDKMSSLGYQVLRQTFIDRGPTGAEYNFTNVWAETNPKLPKLVFACHHDSKVLPVGAERGKSEFVGAVDSSIPCAIVLQLAKQVSLASEDECKGIAEAKKKFSFVFIFFDGEEAFQRWTDTDSLYGSRYFVSHIGETHPGFIRNIEMFTLLDLIGAKDLSFRITSESGTSQCYRSLQNIEENFKNGLIEKSSCHNNFKYHKGHKSYFTSLYMSGVTDDHIPFQQQGVKILHLISVPFPQVWHTMDDNESNLDHQSIENILLILIQFINNNLISCVKKL